MKNSITTNVTNDWEKWWTEKKEKFERKDSQKIKDEISHDLGESMQNKNKNKKFPWELDDSDVEYLESCRNSKTNFIWKEMAEKLLLSGWRLSKYNLSFIWKEMRDELAMYPWSIIVENIEKFKKEDQKDIAKMLIERKSAYELARSIDKFDEINVNEKAEMFIECWRWDLVWKFLDKFEWLNHKEIADKLIKSGDGLCVLDNFHLFKWLDCKEILNRVLDMEIKNGHIDDGNFSIRRYVRYGADDMANKLIKEGKSEFVSYHLAEFWPLNQDTINTLIELDQVAWVKKVDEFEWLDYNETAKKLIETHHDKVFIHYIDKFWLLSKDIACKLIEIWRWKDVIYFSTNFEKFDKEVAEKFIEFGDWVHVAYSLDEFEWLNYIDIANKLIESGNGYSLTKNLEQFKWVCYNKIATKLIEKGGEEEYSGLGSSLHKFKWLKKEIADNLIENGYSFYVADNLNAFVWLDKEIAKKLILHRHGGEVIRNREKFNWLDVNVVKLLNSNWYMRCFINYYREHEEKFDTSILEYLMDYLTEAWYDRRRIL